MVAVFVDSRPAHRAPAVYSRTAGSAMGPPFETFEHDADIGVRGRVEA